MFVIGNIRFLMFGLRRKKFIEVGKCHFGKDSNKLKLMFTIIRRYLVFRQSKIFKEYGSRKGVIIMTYNLILIWFKVQWQNVYGNCKLLSKLKSIKLKRWILSSWMTGEPNDFYIYKFLILGLFVLWIYFPLEEI